VTRASLKKQDVGPARDYFGMKVAEWLTAIFKDKSDPPLFQTYQIVPQFEPTAPTSMTENQKEKFRKCLKDRVAESFFFSIFEAGSKNWIDAPKPGECKAYPYFDALQCGCGSDKLVLLRSIKGALILQTMTGARDRHDGNLQMRNCKLINMDYGHSLGHIAFADNGVFRTEDHYLTVYSDYLKAYLKKSNLLGDEMTEKVNTAEDPIITGVVSGLKTIKKSMEDDKEWVAFEKLFPLENLATWQAMVPLRKKHPLKPLDYMHYLLFGDIPVKPNAKIRLDLDATNQESFVYKMLHDNSDSKIKNHIKNHVIGWSRKCFGDKAKPPETFYTSTLYTSKKPKLAKYTLAVCPN